MNRLYFPRAGTHRMLDSRMVQRPSISLPASINSKPPPKLREIESAFCQINIWKTNAMSPMKSVLPRLLIRTRSHHDNGTHAKYFNHLVMSTTALAFSSDLWTISSRQPTSCRTRFATITSYSFKAADEKARSQGLR